MSNQRIEGMLARHEWMNENFPFYSIWRRMVLLFTIIGIGMLGYAISLPSWQIGLLVGLSIVPVLSIEMLVLVTIAGKSSEH